MNRPSFPASVDLLPYRGKRVLVTGSNGSLGRALRDKLNEHVPTLCFDVDNGKSVLHMGKLDDVRFDFHPDIVFHLAANKHAPLGELDPYAVAHLNVQGTRNVLDAFPNATIVLASTCKAIEPETAYGASKLIAERMVLNHPNGRVARFYNVVETQGNVFETWDNLDPVEKVPVTDCERFFMSKEEAVSLLLFAGHPKTDPGLYSFKTERHYMTDVAKRLYPDRPQKRIHRRRGDRLKEPQYSAYEYATQAHGRIYRVRGHHAAT